MIINLHCQGEIVRCNKGKTNSKWEILRESYSFNSPDSYEKVPNIAKYKGVDHWLNDSDDEVVIT